MDDVELIRLWQKSPLAFIRDNWGLRPQPIKPEYADQIGTADLEEITADWFVPKNRREIINEKLLTWQQYLVVLSVERAIQGKGKRRITVESGHGTGKSAILAMLILWFLFCYLNAQIPCTAPTSDQIFDVLWKEIAIWLGRLQPPIRNKYEWQASYVRITESPETWFARAKTARKEAPEALAGIHGDNVMFVIDEASGVPEEIFNTAEGALTNENILVLMISNHTRTVGYFHDSHTKDKANWQRLSFDSEQSPIVDPDFVERIASKHGRDSDEFRIRVTGKAPREEAMDDKGWVPLIIDQDIRQTPLQGFSGRRRLGVDAAGEGKDKAVWVVRDDFKAEIVASEKKSTPKSMAERTLTVMTQYDILPENVFVDNFGEGANVALEIHVASGQRVNAVNVGDDATDKEMFNNLRAEAFWRARKWLQTGGQLFVHNAWNDELPHLRYKRGLDNRIQIMGKVEMKREGFRSPDHADALMLTFVTDAAYVPDEGPQLSPSLPRLG